MLSAVERHSGGPADHERQGGAEHVAHLRGLVEDLVHRTKREVDEVEIDDGPHSVERGPDAGRYHRRLRNRHVANSFCSELLAQPENLSEVAAAVQKIGPEDEDPVVARHLFAHPLAKGL